MEVRASAVNAFPASMQLHNLAVAAATSGGVSGGGVNSSPHPFPNEEL